MRTLTTIFAVSAFAVLLLSAAILALAIELLPYVAIGCAIAVLIKSRRPQTVAAGQVSYRHHDAAVAPHSVRPSGWAYVPVWVGPAPQSAMPVIDAEVIEEPR